MVVQSTGIGSLPNELLINVLASFPTRALLPLTTVSHRFYNLILRILHNRLIQAASLQDHKLILEVYHPASRSSTPYFMCEYLGTDGFSSAEEEAELYNNIPDAGRLGRLEGLYSHFRPLKPEAQTVVRSHPAGGPITNPSWLGNGLTNGLSEIQDEKYVSQNISLESHELFSQLCTVTNLIKTGPTRGLLASRVEVGDTVTRVWRNWLEQQAASLKLSELRNTFGSCQKEDVDSESRLLWSDHLKHVGLKMRVQQLEDIEPPVWVRRGEEAPVYYTLQYEELVIKTSQLLLKLEQSMEEEVNHSGKAIVIGSWT